MFDSLTIARQLIDAGIDRDHAAAIADAVRQAADHGDHVTPDQFNAGLAPLRTEISGVHAAISAAETRMTWRMLGVGGLVIAAIRLLG